jgi:fumarylacetoacetate (FAA) hydrolase
MKLARLKSEPRFYWIVVGQELFPFQMIVPSQRQPKMPLDAGEFLPILAAMSAEKTFAGRPGLSALDSFLARQQQRLERAGADDLLSFRRPLNPADLDAPVHPLSFRDFYAFERHVRDARRNRGLEMVPEWYEAPAFYFSSVSAIQGPTDSVRRPPDTAELDYELEIAAVIGRPGRDIPVEQADSHIAGFTILNDWSARDIQRREMKVGLGPAKSKDFATTIGPYLVTADALEPRALPDRSRGRRYDLTMTARVNGREISHGNASEMHWTFAELIAHASRNTQLVPGDLIGSGTVGTGCLTEFPPHTYPWLLPGDVVTLEIDELGILETCVTGSD